MTRFYLKHQSPDELQQRSWATSKQQIRIGILVPLSIASQALFFVTGIHDFMGYYSTAGLIVLTTLSPLEEFPVRVTAFSMFLAVLCIDSCFALEAIYQGGLQKVKVLLPLLLHHFGFGAWVLQILLGVIPYCVGNSYVIFLLEFSFSLRLVLGWFYPSTSRGKIFWQIRLFALDMFFSGGGSFTTIFLYGITIVDPHLTGEERKAVLLTYGIAIGYWIFQLFAVHLRNLNAMLSKLTIGEESVTKLLIEENSVIDEIHV